MPSLYTHCLLMLKLSGAHLYFPTLVEGAEAGQEWKASACSSHHNPETAEPS